MINILEMATGQAAAVICKIAEPAARIVPDLGTLFSDEVRKGKQPLEVVASVLPVLLRDHEADTFTILAALFDTTVEDMKAQPLRETIKAIADLLSTPLEVVTADEAV